jgi:hypothetical protein
VDFIGQEIRISKKAPEKLSVSQKRPEIHEVILIELAVNDYYNT